MDFSLNSLLAGFIFGVIGIFLLKRGKSEGNIVSGGVGLALIIYPYFVTNPYLLWGIGGVLLFIAYRER